VFSFLYPATLIRIFLLTRTLVARRIAPVRMVHLTMERPIVKVAGGDVRRIGRRAKGFVGG
jgi:hypothetical protein